MRRGERRKRTCRRLQLRSHRDQSKESRRSRDRGFHRFRQRRPGEIERSGEVVKKSEEGRIETHDDGSSSDDSSSNNGNDVLRPTSRESKGEVDNVGSLREEVKGKVRVS